MTPVACPLGGTVLALAAAVCLYRASTHQRLWATAARPVWWRRAALALQLAGTGLAWPAMGLAAALALTLSAAMLGCTLLPFINAWRLGPAEGARHVG